MIRKKIRKYSEFIGIDSNEFKKRNILDPTINSDIPLFIDPRLLKYSQYKIFHLNDKQCCCPSINPKGFFVKH